MRFPVRFTADLVNSGRCASLRAARPPAFDREAVSLLGDECELLAVVDSPIRVVGLAGPSLWSIPKFHAMPTRWPLRAAKCFFRPTANSAAPPRARVSAVVAFSLGVPL